MNGVVVTHYWMAMVTGMMVIYGIIALIGLKNKKKREHSEK